MSKRKRLIAGLLAFSLLLQPFGLFSPVFAETIETKYTDPDHLHAPKEVNGVVYQYDANGNLENDGQREITWNQDNKPVKIEKEGQVVEFFYDADGRRIIKKVSEDKTVYVNNYYQLSHPADGRPLAETKYYFANGRVGQATAENLNFLHQDYLGSTVLATDSNSQSLGKTLTYFPYGNTISNQQSAISNYLFTNQELDPESNLYNYNARFYNPRTGAFISADTLGGGNRYAYAESNPMVYVDPSGNSIWDVVKDVMKRAKEALYSYSERKIEHYQRVQWGVEEKTNLEKATDIVTVGLVGLNIYYSLPSIINHLQLMKDYTYYNYFYSAPAELATTEGSVFLKSAQEATTALRFGEEFPAGSAGEFEALLKLSKVDPAHTVRPLELTSEGIAMEGLGQPLLDYLRANPGETGRVVSEIETTVSRYHAAGLYHGDINVNNILMRGSTPVFIDPLEQRAYLVGGMQAFDLGRLSELPGIIQRFLWPTGGGTQ